MEPLKLKVALILITVGTVLLLISVSPYQPGGLGCTLTQNACSQIAAQEATTHFFEFLLYGVALISIAVIFLISGKEPRTKPAN